MHHTHCPVGDGGQQPDPDELPCAIDGVSALVEQAGEQNEESKNEMADDDQDENVHGQSTLAPEAFTIVAHFGISDAI